jgi:acylphosphatase
MMIRYEIEIEGRVQGVGFRYFVQKRAAELHIAGWVKNTVDGNVLVLARGERENMKKFLFHLSSGPALARVTRIIKTEIPVSDDLRDFSVKY